MTDLMMRLFGGRLRCANCGCECDHMCHGPMFGCPGFVAR